MAPPLSTHLPGLAGALETVTGEMIVDTGLKDIQTVVVTPNETNIVPDEEATVSWYPLPESSSKIVLRVEKGGANSGIVGTNPFKVSWLALGRR